MIVEEEGEDHWASNFHKMTMIGGIMEGTRVMGHIL
jgi:hypothetical protein